MLGYSESKIEAKAAKRGIEVNEYKRRLIEKRITRNARKRAARGDKFEGTRCYSDDGKCLCSLDKP